MPRILQQRTDASLAIEVWCFEESEALFWSALPLGEADAAAIRSLKLERRRLERLGCRMALLDLLGSVALPQDLRGLAYDGDGRPVMKGLHVSFSHSGRYAAVAVSRECPVGIDIEVIGERVCRLHSRFLNQTEVAECDTSDNLLLHYYWGAKEAIYKADRVADPFREITIKPYEGAGIVEKKAGTIRYRLYHQIIGGCCMVAARPEII